MTSAYASSILRKNLCHASRSKKPQNQTKRADFPKNGNLQKPKPLSFMLILLALLCGGTVGWGQQGFPPYHNDPQSLREWRGQNDGSFKITRDTVIGDLVDVYSGKKLYLYPIGTPTITKTVEAGELFKVRDEGELYIIGKKGDTLKIYGNSGNPDGPIPSQTTYQGAAIFGTGTPEMNPQIWLKYVEFYGFITNTCVDGSDGDNHTQGGIVTMGNNGTNTSKGVCRMDHVTFKNSFGGPVNTKHEKGFGRIISFVKGVWEVQMDYVTIHDCIISEWLGGHHYIGAKIDGMGSVIRSQGQVGGYLFMNNCKAYNNTYRDLSGSLNHSILDYNSMDDIKAQPLSGQGGVLNWRSGRTNPNDGGTQVRIIDCEFYNNSARQGGAIATCATITMNDTKIHNNEAVSGGGVYFYPYAGGDNPYDGRAFDAKFESGVSIHDNKATQYGGGIYVGINASDDVGFKEKYPGGTPAWNPAADTASVLFQVIVEEGAKIYNNKAPKGGGIAIRDSAPYRHYNQTQNLLGGAGSNPAYHQWSGVYRRLVSIEGGDIYNNTTLATPGSEVAGGGIYIEKHLTDNTTFGNADYNYNGEPGIYGSGTLTVNPGKGKIYNNSAINGTDDGYGGGIYIASKFTNPAIVSTLNVNIGEAGKDLQMYKNQAYTDGGGVYVWYDRTDGRKNEGTVTVAGGTIGKTNLETGNKALTGNGGGICVMGGTVFVNGGKIEYNTAGELGGGVYVSVPNNNSKTTIQGGANISENTAKGGGGVYVDKGELDVFGNTWNNTTGEWEMLDWTGYTNPASETTHTRITNNSATDGNGGGINAGNGEVDLINTLIYHNTASGTVSKGRGGGVYLDGGFINIVSSKILYNTAQTNGGGIDDHSGDIEIYGGDISHNTATNGRGGGVYTNAGDIRIWPSALYNNPASAPSLNDCKNTGTVFSYNTAGTNGGGLNTHIGRLDVRYAKVHHNVAGHNYTTIGTQGGSGGGMFCEGPHADLSGYTVRLLHTLLNYNKAYGNGGSDDNLTGRGGGLYLKYGSIFAEHCNILGNKADINGGGLDNHDGELRVYGSIIGKSLEETMPEDCKTEDDDENGNRAISGRGGGLYTDKGNLVVGPCDSYGFVESKASRICNNTAYINGGGINNHEGDITIHGDRINNNTAVTGDGGGVYINSGQIYMYGGQINNNKADNGKGGGVYGGGGTFNIMEREAHPILEILDVEGITTSGFTVHFHHVDRGNAMKEDAKNKEYGIAFSVNPYPSDLGENVDWTGHWQDVTTVKVGPTNGTPIPTAPHTYNQNEGCSRFVASGLTSGKTYYVVAYGKYTYDEKDYFDASPAVAVKTHGDNPVVVTGVAFDITTNSASVNGKLFYEGVGTLLEKGIEISSDYGTNWVKHPAQSVGDVFSVTFSGLEPSRIYKARAYAVCQNGGNQYESQDAEIITFFTLGNNPVVATGEATEITETSATVSGKLLYAGDDPGTVTKGIEISSDYGANWEKHSAQSVGNVFSVTFSGLEPSRIYKARAYATCQSGENQYESQDAEIITFFTLGNSPVVATGEASVTANSATVAGELLYVGDGSSTVTKGIRYSTGEGNWTNVLSSGSEDVFSVDLTELESGIYHAQAYATNNLGHTGYGEIITFTIATGSKAPQGPRSVYPAVEENPFFMELTPLQQAMLANALEGDTTAAPAPRAITDSDDPNQEKPVDIPQINKNTARYGGGICIDKQGAELIFAGSASESRKGQININFASEAGGGIYIGRESVNEYAQMQMMDKCEVNYNYVPTGKLGGGIYLDGRLYVGENDTDENRHGLRVDRNFTSDTDTTAWMHYTWTPEYNPGGDSKLNNVFLPRSEYDYDEHSDDATANEYNKISVITLLSDLSGKDASNKYYSHIGFSVPKGFCPVIATAKEFGGDYKVHADYEGATDAGSEEWLYKLMDLSGESGNDQISEAMRGAVFEDSESYVAVHTRNDMPPFRMKYIYLWGCWTHPVVNEDPEKDTGPVNDPDQSMVGTGKHYKIIKKDEKNILTWEIYSPEGLSWFSSYVNGLNAFDEKTGDGDDDDKHAAWNENINPYANAYIMNDLDMSAYLWVPIGSVQKFYKSALTEEGSLFVDSETHVLKKQQKIDPDTGEPIINSETGEPETEWVIDSDYSNNKHYYRGTFDGQGHIIKGLQGLYLTGIEKFGLFGYLADSAVVKNTFVDEGLFVSDNVEVVYSAGGIAGTMQNNEGKVPVVSNSEARMSMNVGHCDYGTNLGGLVGEMKAGIIHSCMAMPTMVGQLKGFSGEKPRVKAFEGSMGGLVGKLGDGCSLKNSFANVKLTLIETAGATVDANANNRFLGGIVGQNNGTIENVYVRYNNSTNTPDLTNTQFYWIAGTNNTADNIKYCFTPDGITGNGSEQEQWDYAPESKATLRRTYQSTELVSDKYGFAHQDQAIQAFDNDSDSYIENGPIGSDGNLKGLLATLNNWVEDANKTSTIYTPWTRTMASTINDDYPVLMFNDFNVVGTEDGIYMKYDDNVNDMWKKPNYESLIPADRTGKNFQGLTSYNNPKAAMYLYKTNGVTANNSTPVAINVTGNTAVRLYIHENVGITQTDGAELHARVGVTFDNSNGSPLPALGGKAYDWHMFSSALQSAPMGLKYYDDIVNYPIQSGYESLSGTPTADNGIEENNYTSRVYMDPPRTSWYQSDNPSSILNNYDANKIGYFPTNTPYGSSKYNGSAGAPETSNGSFDFYCFSEQHRHWINFKRQGRPASQDVEKFFDHWHQDANDLNGQLDEGRHYNIEYPNESTFQVGKGYMMGVSAVSMLMADGILNNGVKSNENEPAGISSAEDLTNSDYAFNPSGYSEELRGTNLVGNPFQSYLNFSALANDDDNKNIIENGAYYLFDADAGRYLCYPADASTNPINAPQFIHPHQGFFVKTANGGKLTFKNSMRSATAGNGSTFRGDNLNYPLVNLFCYDAEGHYDVTTVEMNRPKLGGGLKLKDMRNGNSLIYARLEDEDYQTLFAPTGTSTVPVRFEPSQNGVYTMRWGTLHGDFHYLHLIDNMSGADVDMLRSEEYRFEATTSDYISRFKLVFEVTDVEENPIEAEATTFAFRMGDEIIVNGAGYLEVFDVQGRRLSAKRLVDAQSSVSLPNVAAGIYFLRLSDDKQVRTQKMVINY